MSGPPDAMVVTRQAEAGSFVSGEEQSFRSVEELVALIARKGQKNDWWTLNRWKGASRADGWKWLGASGVILDFDYRVRGAPVEEVWPRARVEALKAACKGGDIPGNLIYRTPHGLRCAWVFDQPLVRTSAAEADTYEGAVVGAARLVEQMLERVLGADFQFDSGSKELNRIMYMPGALAKGVLRNFAALVLREDRYQAEDLVPEGYVPEAVREVLQAAAQKAEKVNKGRGGSPFLTAVAAYETRHGRSYSRKLGRCPLHEQGHRCFKALLSGSGKWICYSDWHERGGVKKHDYWYGNTLDLDAAKNGISPEEMLVRAGLWKPRRKNGGV